MKIIGSRFTDKYLQSRYTSAFSSSSSRVYPIPLPSRKTSKSTHSMMNTRSSPSRQVVTDFKVFSSSTPKSFSDATSSPPSFGGNSRWSPSHQDEEDEEDEEAKKRIMDADPNTTTTTNEGNLLLTTGSASSIDVRQGSISFDQARRITTSAAWRTIRT